MMMKNNQKLEKKSDNKKKRVMIIHSDGKNLDASDFYPMQNWSLEDWQLWRKIMLKMKNSDS